MIHPGNPWRRCALLRALVRRLPLIVPAYVRRCRATHAYTPPALSNKSEEQLAPGRALSPPPPCASARPAGLLCISHRSGGRGVGITAGLHIRPLFTTAGPGTSRLPASSPPMCKMCRALRPARGPSGHTSLTYGQLPGPAGQAGRQAGRRKGGREGRDEGEEVNVGERSKRGDQNRFAGKKSKKKGGWGS